MGYYLKWPNDGGSETANNQLCQLSGIATSGTVTVALELAEDNTTHTGRGYRAYLYDGRRMLDSTTSGSGGYLYTTATTGWDSTQVGSYTKNGISTTRETFETCVAGDVFGFSFDGTGPAGVISIGCRLNQVAAWWGLALRKITITDTNGTHIVDMSSSNGTADTFTSLDGIVTLKLFGFTGGQWVFYSTGGGTVSASAAYDIGAIDYAATSTVAAPNITAALSYDIGAIDYAVASTVTVAGNAASVSFDIGEISYSAAATVGVSSSAAYSIGDITYNASALASVTASAAYDIGSVEFTASASVVGDVSAAIGYDIGSVSFSVLMSVPTGEPERSLTTVNNPSWRDSIFFKQFRRH